MIVTGFRPEDALELVRLWRASFEHGVGVTDPHPIDEQIAFLRTAVLPSHSVHVARSDDTIVGFVACNAQSIGQLYVRVDRIGQGIGSRLLALAQDASAGTLWLYTFARNRRACRFYERRGFVEAARGFEADWQLEDVRYEWTRDR